MLARLQVQMYPLHTRHPLQVGARGSAPHFAKHIKHKRRSAGASACSNFGG